MTSHSSSLVDPLYSAEELRRISGVREMLARHEPDLIDLYDSVHLDQRTEISAETYQRMVAMIGRYSDGMQISATLRSDAEEWLTDAFDLSFGSLEPREADLALIYVLAGKEITNVRMKQDGTDRMDTEIERAASVLTGLREIIYAHFSGLK